MRRDRRSADTVRVRLGDGEVLEGTLIGASPDHVAVGTAGASKVRRLVVAEIRAIDLAVPRRGREWALAGVGIAGITAALVGYSVLPWVDPLSGDLNIVVRLLAGSIGVLSLVVARTRLGRWLTRWRRLYAADGA